MKKPNFTITIRYEIPTFSSVEPFFEEGGRGSRKVRPETELFGIFSIEVAPKPLYKIREGFKKKIKQKSDFYHFWGGGGGSADAFYHFFLFGLEMIFKQF